MNNAQQIIDKFGGQTALARSLGRPQSTVQYWAKTGTIPAKWHRQILSVARDEEIELRSGDFIEVSEDDAQSNGSSGTLVQKTVWASIEDAASDDLVDNGAVESVTSLPEAKYKGFLNLMGFEIPCYVLENGQRVIGRTSATEMLTGIKGGGSLGEYIGVSSLKPFIDLVIRALRNGFV